MFELEYYTIKELSERLERIANTPVSVKQLVHYGIKGKLPIYIAPEAIARSHFVSDWVFTHVERGYYEFEEGGRPFSVPEYRGCCDEFERLSLRSLKELDQLNAYDDHIQNCISASLWVEEGRYAYAEIGYSSDGVIREEQPLPVTINDLFIMAKDASKLEEECKARSADLPVTNSKRESLKPYQLIHQLITLILPDADISKPYQLYDALNRKLKSDDLVVSKDTLKAYLEKL